MIPNVLLHAAIERALREDLHAGDPTSSAVVAEDARALGRAVAKEALVACGSQVFASVFYAVDRALRVEELVTDGTPVRAGSVLYHVEGPARSILSGERTALNFVQRMAGIASMTRRFVDALPAGCTTRITDTRKTTPGLRAFERYAVRAGGAHNHRDSLGAGVLIKDNHIAAAGGIEAAVRLARQGAPHAQRIEVEVDSLGMLEAALGAGVDIVMLDNFSEHDLAAAVAMVAGRALIEVSGGIGIGRIAGLASLGVDVISVGALTHSAPAADISLELELLGD